MNCVAVYVGEIKEKCGIEEKSVYEHEALVWLSKSLDPLPLRKITGMRIWNAYKKKYGTGKLSQRGLYSVIRQLLEEEKYKTKKVVFKKCSEGLILNHIMSNSNLETVKMVDNIEEKKDVNKLCE